MAYDAINTSMVKQYSANVQHLLQQRGSRLRGAVTLETGKIGEEVFMDRIDATDAVEVTNRHADSPLMDVPHDRRRVTPKDYDWGKLVDNPDKLRLIMDPASAYVESAAMAMGRKIDDIIIDAAFGTSYGSESTSGADANTPITWSDWTDGTKGNQLIAKDFVQSGTAADKGLTVDKLIRAQRLLQQNEADDYDIGGGSPLFIVCSSAQIEGMLNDPSYVNRDFSPLYALYTGEVDSFMGFNFIRTEKLPTYVSSGSTFEKVLIFHRAGLGLCIWEDIVARVDERADKRFSQYIYFRMTMGATRLEEKRVIQTDCLVS